MTIAKYIALRHGESYSNSQIEDLMWNQTAYPFIPFGRRMIQQIDSAVRANRSRVVRCEFCVMPIAMCRCEELMRIADEKRVKQA